MGILWTYICIFHSKTILLRTCLRKTNERKMIYLFYLAKVTPVKSLKSELSPIQYMNYICLENVFDRDSISNVIYIFLLN